MSSGTLFTGWGKIAFFSEEPFVINVKTEPPQEAVVEEINDQVIHEIQMQNLWKSKN